MTTKRLTVELEPDPVPRGRVVGEGGQGFPFEGWVGLAAALEHARGAPAETESDGPADGDPGRTAPRG